MLVIYAKLLGFVGKFSDLGLQYLGRQRNIAPGILQRIDDHFALQIGNGILQGQGRHRIGFFAGLQGRRQMITVNNALFTQ